jgi:predicted dithiol-disulfide oxidoreductase (DUF899 family)
VPVEKEYTFETDEGKKTLAELFDGRSQLLAYNLMFGPDCTVGACPGCSNLGDHLDAALVHLNHRDVTLLGFSRAPLPKLQAYKQRMGWKFPYVSTYGSDFPFDFDLALTEQQMAEIDDNGVVHHTYPRMAPDRDFVVPYYHLLLDRTPKGRVDDFRAWRHDEYDDAS